MLQMVSLMLDNNVDKIRAKANMDLKKKLTSLSVESARVQRIQVCPATRHFSATTDRCERLCSLLKNTLNAFGATEAVLSIIARSSNLDPGSAYFTTILPTALHLAKVSSSHSSNENSSTELIRMSL